jgi:hypothetical protein
MTGRVGDSFIMDTRSYPEHASLTVYGAEVYRVVMDSGLIIDVRVFAG